MSKTILTILLISVVVLSACTEIDLKKIIDSNKASSQENILSTFDSCKSLSEAFEESRNQAGFGGVRAMLGSADMAVAESAKAVPPPSSTPDYSKTNVQVEGIDEADVVKTDGRYIYTISKNKLFIVEAYPADKAEVLSEIDLSKLDIKNFYPMEMFIDRNSLLIFGSSYYERQIVPLKSEESSKKIVNPLIAPPGRIGLQLTTVLLFDISDRNNPSLERTLDFEGNYITSRKIDSHVYFVLNNYPAYYGIPEIAPPQFRDSSASESFADSVSCSEVQYFKPAIAQNFITVAGFDMSDFDSEVNKEVMVGSGQNVYASEDNLYVVQTEFNYMPSIMKANQEIISEESSEKTRIHKFNLDDGKIGYQASGTAKGHILNQFSMDEYEENFRIATTISSYSNSKDTSTNSIYVFDDKLDLIGKVEDIAFGESIYSARFMGDRAYLVTFKHVDPLFVVDLKDPYNPQILGKLKIPGYSDYLHPYDETHLIGIGKEVDESIDADKVHTEGAVYYTAIQGVKLAIFDVSDVSNPKEMYKEVIGDRGTESLAAADHKAFLFDKERNLLIIPITLAERREGQPKNIEGEFVFQGAYVYDITLDNGFELKGRITHHNDPEIFKKSGYYFDGGDSMVRRSLFIDSIIYTISNSRIQLHDIDDVGLIKELKLENAF